MSDVQTLQGALDLLRQDNTELRQRHGRDEAVIKAQSKRLFELEAEKTALTDRIEQLERELAEERLHATECQRATEEMARNLAAEKALAAGLDGGLKIAQDIIEAASKLLTKKAGTKWGLWYLDRISELRAAYRKARGM